jgi:hypothetical protein
MFTAQDVLLDVAFADARALLVNLVTGSTLTGASQAAYREGLASLAPVGLPAASRLARVRFLSPADRADGMAVGLRWEATGVTGSLFPVLDADITLRPAGEQATRLMLAGVYRLPPSRLGGGLDRTGLQEVADATIRALLRHLADALTAPRRQLNPRPALTAARCHD